MIRDSPTVRIQIIRDCVNFNFNWDISHTLPKILKDPVEEGADRLQESGIVDFSNKTLFVGNDVAIAHMDSQWLYLKIQLGIKSGIKKW